ncbi:MAG: hypothetical protein E6Q97_34170 [Desulfurellales bacterium]|nr:MAG: hypothetical protein E6Q97_34170 [Desulfurellales bacterium]
MVAGPVKTFVDRMMDLQGDPRIEITSDNLLKPCLDAELHDISEARVKFLAYIECCWNQLEERHQNASQVMLLRQMISRASTILDTLSLASGTKATGCDFSLRDISSQGVVSEVDTGISLPELPGSHCNLDGYPHVG